MHPMEDALMESKYIVAKISVNVTVVLWSQWKESPTSMNPRRMNPMMDQISKMNPNQLKLKKIEKTLIALTCKEISKEILSMFS